MLPSKTHAQGMCFPITFFILLVYCFQFYLLDFYALVQAYASGNQGSRCGASQHICPVRCVHSTQESIQLPHSSWHDFGASYGNDQIERTMMQSNQAELTTAFWYLTGDGVDKRSNRETPDTEGEGPRPPRRHEYPEQEEEKANPSEKEKKSKTKNGFPIRDPIER